MLPIALLFNEKLSKKGGSQNYYAFIDWGQHGVTWPEDRNFAWGRSQHLVWSSNKTHVAWADLIKSINIVPKGVLQLTSHTNWGIDSSYSEYQQIYMR